jgi:Tfp pilus assembly protein PilF
VAALQAGKLNNAERPFKSVLRAEPEHVGALNRMGVVLTQSKRFAEAENYFRRALQQQEQSDATFYNYDIVLKALKRPAEAVQRFSEALKINSSVAARNRDTYPLFDTARFTRHIEAAYTTMWERQQRGERPEAFAVKPIT